MHQKTRIDTDEIDALTDEEFAQLTDEEFLAWLKTPRRVFDWEPYININPQIVFGKPRINGTRLAAEFILDLFAAGMTREQVLDSYPNLNDDALRAVFAYAADCVREKQEPPWPKDRV